MGRTVRPSTVIDEARQFDFSRLSYTRTDKRGVIQSANALFAKATGYDPKIMREIVRLRRMEKNARQERDVTALQSQNTAQEATIAAHTQRMIAREDAHAQHREDMGTRMDRFEVTQARTAGKIDQLLRGRTPMPRDYGTGQGGRQGGE